MLQALKAAVSILDKVIGFFNGPNPSNRTMILASTQPLTEISTRNIPGGKRWPVRKADNFTAIFEAYVPTSLPPEAKQFLPLLNGGKSKNFCWGT
jgi:hypothetical protein